MPRMFDDAGQPIYQDHNPNKEFPEGYSIMPFFPGYVFSGGKSTYKGEEVGEGGYVYAEPGMYGNVAVLDITSMHPASIVAENLFGDEYTARFRDIRDIRIAIKNGEFEKARGMLGGNLAKYLEDEGLAKNLAGALKIAINSVYGLTSASFENRFHDPRNKDNIVAKRGALFMINLKYEVIGRGYRVAHIKTDSIKIPDADEKIIDFVKGYGEEFGYTFLHEETYDRLCLVNDAVFIAKFDAFGKRNEGGKHAGEWDAVGTQFQVPYVFKKLFSKEPIAFDDLCETKSVSTALHLDYNENLQEGGHKYQFVGKVGRFCPVKPGFGGGLLMRETKNAKTGQKGYFAATGSKGYRWLEAEFVKSIGREDLVDKSYYDRLVDEAVKTISEFGDFEWFVSDDPYVPVTYPSDKPPWD